MSSLYEQDFYQWTQQQAEYLRLGKLDLLDRENLQEELLSLGKQQRQELRNRLGILLGHLLKWHYQPTGQCKSWRATIREQRRRIKQHLQENPSLKPYLPEAIALGYKDGLDLIDQEPPLSPEQLPPICPFSEAEIFTELLNLPAAD
ncbi:hypothetical protein GlitD10_0721 [Gloeomargarita lithophora Alchichica-D10]|uniref:DUF29 domain-containing protein n=1 Tax=Gloeomargarita lithophora Alchichica-D10 TaxID=1188229 RepID=A0A1J0AAS6_9CYAN|nr:DUF29 domain-containing protein [Gloeomargarita lithophora]APB33035.1 hypothetical protein GlitD10_0721 [Gloeomargarita lithophora Alchichica-D10]